MRIGIDAVAANRDVRIGPGEYAFRLLCTMMGSDEARSSDEILLYTERPFVRAWPSLPARWASRVLSWSFPGFVTVRLNAELLRAKLDVAFFPAGGVPLFAPGRSSKKRASVATVHDIGFARVPGVYAPSDRRRQKRAVQRMIKKCRQLLAVSEFTKRELVDVYQVQPERIVVIPPGIDTTRFRRTGEEEIAHVRSTYHLSQHYFLFVSRLDAKKNVENLIRAFTIFKEARGFGDPHELVLVGPDGFQVNRIRSAVSTSSVASSIHLLGAVSEEEKIALYSGALGYVNVSWYEGFGFTPLEAAACGTPSLLSDIPAHREVMGEGALYVTPSAPESIATHLKRFAEDASLREAILEKAQSRLPEFPWERTAERTWELLRGVRAPDRIFQTKL